MTEATPESGIACPIPVRFMLKFRCDICSKQLDRTHGEDGSRRLVGLGVAGTGPSSPRKAPPRGLRGRGVSGARCVVPDDHGGLARAIAEVSRGAARRRRVARPGRDVASWFPKREDKAVATAAMRAVLAERDPRPVRAACRQATERIARPEPRAGEPPGGAGAGLGPTSTSPTGTTSACARATCGNAPTRRQGAGPRSSTSSRRPSRWRASWARCPWTPTRGGWGRASSTRPRPRAPPGPRRSRSPSPTTSRGGRGYAS